MPWGLYAMAPVFAMAVHVCFLSPVDTYLATYTISSNSHVKRISGVTFTTDGSAPNEIQARTLAARNHGVEPSNIGSLNVRRVYRYWRFSL